MNSITFSHSAAPAQGEFLLDVALDRLGAWLDAELGSLEDLIEISGRRGDANEDIVALRNLHLEAASTQADIKQLLENAQAALERLMECLQAVSPEDVVDTRAPSNFDAWLRWTGARLQDIAITLSRALET